MLLIYVLQPRYCTPIYSVMTTPSINTQQFQGSTLNQSAHEDATHLHEHFLDPVMVRGGSYMPPSKPGYSGEMKPDALVEYELLIV